MTEKTKRTKEIKLRLTEAEHQRLRVLAGDAPLAEWVREFALSAAQSDIFEHIQRQQAKQAAKREAERERLTVDPELLRALRGIGNNVNQIARIINAAHKSGSALNLVAVGVELGHISRALDGLRDNHRGNDQ